MHGEWPSLSVLWARGEGTEGLRLVLPHEPFNRICWKQGRLPVNGVGCRSSGCRGKLLSASLHHWPLMEVVERYAAWCFASVAQQDIVTNTSLNSRCAIMRSSACAIQCQHDDPQAGQVLISSMGWVFQGTHCYRATGHCGMEGGSLTHMAPGRWSTWDVQGP